MRHRAAVRVQPSSPVDRLKSFFFAEEVPYGLAILRILLPLSLMIDLLSRWSHVRELYSSDGATAPIWATYGFPNPIPELPGAVAVALFTLMLAAMLSTSAGWMTRLSATIATLLYLYFTSLDALSTLTKYTVIGSHLMLLLAVSNCGAIWSIDALRNPTPNPRFPVWPRRLVQILIGVVYIGAAMTKMHTPSYLNGDQMLFWMLTHVNGTHPVGEWLAHYPAVLVVGGYAAILFETLFLFLAWRGPGRIVMLALGVGFHVATYFTLGLLVFPCVMIAAYFSFLGERDAWRIGQWARRNFYQVSNAVEKLAAAATRFAVPARRLGPAAFVGVLWMAAIAGAGAERLMDPYRKRGSEGPLPLATIDDATARKLLSGAEPLRPEDKLFSFEIGTDLFGDTLIGRRRVFENGDALIAQCIAPPPHGDAYVECLLHSVDGRLLERANRVLLRESTRVNFTFNICDAVPPGDYELVLRMSGREVSRKAFSVDGESAAPPQTASTWPTASTAGSGSSPAAVPGMLANREP